MPKLAGVPFDQLSVACLVAVKLKVGNRREQRLKKRLTLDERQARDIAAVEMQEIESEIDETNPAWPVARGLGLRKTRQPVVTHAAQFAVEIRGFRPHFRERFNDAWIFAAPIEAGPRQQLHPTAVDARGHAETVEFDLMQPLRPEGAVSMSWQSWGGIQRGRDDASF